MDRHNKIRSTLLNIDSSFRLSTPKNIYTSCSTFNNNIYFTKDSNVIRVNYPNHGFSMGDTIIMQNVQGSMQILANSFYLLNGFNYMVINYNNEVPYDYNNYINNIYINISCYDDITMDNIIDNIQINNFMGIQIAYNYKDISNLAIINNFCSANNIDINNLLFIKLPYNYINSSSDYIIINQIFQISMLNIAGIPLGYLNANYPINNYNYQSHFVITVNTNDTNNFYIN